MSVSAPRRRLLILGLFGAMTVSAVLALAHAPAADADLLPQITCGSQPLQQPFTQWGDYNDYVLVDGGTFEPGVDPWSLGGGAQVVQGNEPWYVNSPSDSQSLSLPSGSSATSPPTCVALDSPTLRFFATSDSADPGSRLEVDVTFDTLLGGTATLPIGYVGADGQWEPSPALPILVNALPNLGGQANEVEFTFTPLGSANWQIDDVYVDPWSKG